MVVEDDPDLRKASKIILENAGYRVIEATDGDEALKKVDSERPDLILSDVVMPNRSGLEVCKILKNRPETRLIPILLFIVLGRDIDKKLGEGVGADGYIVKPFTTNDLVAEVRKHLESAAIESDLDI